MDYKGAIRVSKNHYFKVNYDDLHRFISYFYQIDLVRSLKPKSILEIGIGNKTVSNYLKSNGFRIDTCDFDSKLKPDFVCDIRNLRFRDNSYDVVMACEILEHLIWDDVDKALGELHRVSKKHVVLSVPYPSIAYLELMVKFPFVYRIFKRHFIDLFFRIPLFLKRFVKSGEHQWEIGTRDYPINRLRRLMRKRFIILREVRPNGDSYHHFFVLEKKLSLENADKYSQ